MEGEVFWNMKCLKKIFIISIVLVITISWTAGCSRNIIHNTSTKSTQVPTKEPEDESANGSNSNTEKGVSNETAEGNEEDANVTSTPEDDQALLDSLAATDAQSKKEVDKNAKIPDEFTGKNVVTKGTGYYHCDFEEDRNYVKSHGIDITVGDNLYMTQINDWFTNFDDYNGKTVEIEGYYLNFDPYSFVGRYGPTCPYCTGGFVDFEFITDQDISTCKDSQTWIKVEGILRKGYDTGIAGEFYYIEATSIEVQDKAGKDTVKN